MTRKLGQLDPSEKDNVISAIQREAQEAGWHDLSNQNKSALYNDWSNRFDLSRTAIKDQVMKGFDAAQHIPPTGEAAVHERLKELFEASSIPYWNDKVPSWAGRGVVDFVLGFTPDWIVVTAELESAINWQQGLMQALWYRSAYFNQTGLQALPALVLFGDVTEERWDEIKTTCLGLSVLLQPFELNVAGARADNSLGELLNLL